MVEFAAHATDQAITESASFASTFGQVATGAPLLYLDSSGRLAFADNQGNVAARLGIRPDRPTRITRG
jgi:S-adenosylmethionine hydrolase